MEAGHDGMEARQGTGKKRDRVDRLGDYINKRRGDLVLPPHTHV